MRLGAVADLPGVRHVGQAAAWPAAIAWAVLAASLIGWLAKRAQYIS